MKVGCCAFVTPLRKFNPSDKQLIVCGAVFGAVCGVIIVIASMFFVHQRLRGIITTKRRKFRELDVVSQNMLACCHKLVDTVNWVAAQKEKILDQQEEIDKKLDQLWERNAEDEDFLKIHKDFIKLTEEYWTFTKKLSMPVEEKRSKMFEEERKKKSKTSDQFGRTITVYAECTELEEMQGEYQARFLAAFIEIHCRINAFQRKLPAAANPS